MTWYNLKPSEYAAWLDYIVADKQKLVDNDIKMLAMIEANPNMDTGTFYKISEGLRANIKQNKRTIRRNKAAANLYRNSDAARAGDVYDPFRDPTLSEDDEDLFVNQAIVTGKLERPEKKDVV